MGGPCKNLETHTTPDSGGGKAAKARHAPPNRAEIRLSQRRKGYEGTMERNKLDPRAFHQPGSQNISKV